MTAPTIYLTNAASRRAPQRGPGRVWTIMAAPRAAFGEAGEGRVEALVPPLDWVRDALAGRMPMAEYRERYGFLLAQRASIDGLTPGMMVAGLPDKRWVTVGDGDTLVCACSRARAAEGRCHRCWAAAALLQAGWRVVLDGELL